MELKVNIPENINAQDLFGNYDTNVKTVERITETTIVLRDGALIIDGGNPELAAKIIAKLIEALNINPNLDSQRLNYIIDMEVGEKTFDEKEVASDVICYTHLGKPLKPKTSGQKHYVDNIRSHDMVFGIGPAGTGKTFVAVLLAINSLRKGEVNKIIITRPAVEAVSLSKTANVEKGELLDLLSLLLEESE